MAHIQMTDRNPSDLKPMEELTDGELLAINGGREIRPIPLPHPIRRDDGRSAPPPNGYRPSAWYEDLYYQKIGRIPRAI